MIGKRLKSIGLVSVMLLGILAILSNVNALPSKPTITVDNVSPRVGDTVVVTMTSIYTSGLVRSFEVWIFYGNLGSGMPPSWSNDWVIDSVIINSVTYMGNDQYSATYSFIPHKEGGVVIEVCAFSGKDGLGYPSGSSQRLIQIQSAPFTGNGDTNGNGDTTTSGFDATSLFCLSIAIVIIVVIVIVVLFAVKSSGKKKTIPRETIPQQSIEPKKERIISPKFCPYCGSKSSGTSFCAECGKKLGG